MFRGSCYSLLIVAKHHRDWSKGIHANIIDWDTCVIFIWFDSILPHISAHAIFGTPADPKFHEDSRCFQFLSDANNLILFVRASKNLACIDDSLTP